MAFTPKKSQRELIPEGIQQAICYGVVDMGTQDGGFGPKPEMRIFWEFPAIRMLKDKDGNDIDKPRVINQSYNPSLHPKSNLGMHLTSWRGKSFTEDDVKNFDFFSVIGLSCQLTIIHKKAASGSMYDKIISVVGPAVPKDTENPHMRYAIEEHGKNIPEGLYDFLKDDIKKSPEYNNEQGPADFTPDDSSSETPDDYTPGRTEDEDPPF